jgi:class 3 adenylate cyclase/TolB-like protein/Flp pilus assembly protein TadD
VKSHRYLVTVLFTDIVGSTEKAAELGDRRWRELLRRHHELVRQELWRFGGRELSTTGDGFLATFKHPEQAIACARAVSDSVRQLGIEIRSGLHAGEVEVIEGPIGGIAVHTAARIAAHAGPGEVLVSRALRDFVAGSGWTFEDRGAHELKGVPGEWRLFATSGEPPELPEAGGWERARQTRLLRSVASIVRRRRIPLAFTTLALGFLLGLGILFAWRSSDRGAGSGERKVVAVLPFENLGAAEDEYFADGMTDEIRGKLATLPGLQVIASQSSGEYKESAKSLDQIADELGANYLVVGNVRWEKTGEQSRVRVSPELVEVVPGRAPTTEWQAPFDAALTDVFEVQADIAGRVAAALDVALGSEEREALAAKPTANLEAYDAYLKGVEAAPALVTAGAPSVQRAIGFFEEAVALDPGFAPAWAQLARAQARYYAVGVPSSAGATRAREAAERAMALAPGRPESALALGDYYTYVRDDASKALDVYATGLRGAPSDADLLTATAFVEQTLGRWEAALDHFTRAHALDPRSVPTAIRLARSLLWLRRYPEAAAAYDRAHALDPTNVDGIEGRTMVELARGDLTSARTVLRAPRTEVDPGELVAYMATYWDLVWVLDDGQQRLLVGLDPDLFGDRGTWGLVLAQAYALRGDQTRARVFADSARIAFEEVLLDAPDDDQVHVLLGLTFAYLGRKEDAMREGERAVALQPIARDAYSGPYNQHQLARIYMLVGEPEKALDQLEPLLEIPYYLSPGWLRIDPNFEPLRGNPRFERLAAGS